MSTLQCVNMPIQIYQYLGQRNNTPIHYQSLEYRTKFVYVQHDILWNVEYSEIIFCDKNCYYEAQVLARGEYICNGHIIENRYNWYDDENDDLLYLRTQADEQKTKLVAWLSTQSFTNNDLNNFIIFLW